jgi:PEP-CTERM motif
LRGLNVTSLVNQNPAASDVLGKSAAALGDAVRMAPDFDRRVSAVETWIGTMLERRDPECAIGLASRRMIAARGGADRGSRCGIRFERRQFARRFEARVGMTPKLFARMIRFAGRWLLVARPRTGRGPMSFTNSAISIKPISSANAMLSPACRQVVSLATGTTLFAPKDDENLQALSLMLQQALPDGSSTEEFGENKMNIRSMFSRIAIAGVASLLASPSFAQLLGDGAGGCLDNQRLSLDAAGTVCANVQLRSSDGTPMVSSPLPDVNPGPVSASGGVGGSAKGALAAASGDFGEVHLDGSAFFGVTENPVQAEGFAFASFTDGLIVTKTANATFTESADGVFLNAMGGLELRVVDWTTDQLVVDTYYDILGDSFPDHTITEDVFLRAGDTYVVFAAFEALAGTAANLSTTAFESKADMSNTGQLFIDAPAGSFTTISGHDYSTDAGVSGVPEPSTWAMMGLGFVGLGFAASRRVGRPPSQSRSLAIA